MGFNLGEECGYTRDDALQCLKDHVDANHDQIIEESEFERAKRKYLPAQAKAAVWVATRIGLMVKFKQIVHDCDADKDGVLTMSDWKHSEKTCLATKYALCMLKTVCDLAKEVDEADAAQRRRLHRN